MAHPVSPLAPLHLPELPAVRGVSLARVETNIRYHNRPDLLLMHFVPGSVAAGVFTQSTMAAAPVPWCRACLKKGQARALLINAGNANAFTGKAGQALVKASAAAVARAVAAKSDEVLLASTGVIGQPLPPDCLAKFVPGLAKKLGQTSWAEAAETILTTDTFAKVATRTVRLNGKNVVLVGMAKGSGMIAPDMATLISVVVTDAAIDQKILQKFVAAAANKSFNCITVDGDTSTNDTLLVVATQQAENKKIVAAAAPDAKKFYAALESLLITLAQLVARDGEGAQKLITIDIVGAKNAADAKKAAHTIANSPLVKTAIAGEDANWGRIVAAIGRSGAVADRDKLKIWMGGTLICSGGRSVAGYDETPVVAHVKGRDVRIKAHLGVGKAAATVWTCDLTHGYININGHYRS
ncbi:MAG: bifunctional glutamate N-acetyltransferase/amino-acid acetyltransferase ArgJ [Alphaproteobacteria bacterium]|nr:bifunctional glutamate N-acetyltransferase/amino-acid acetyltransferase ArgJ [Alphaproteobacteria bacterium]NDC55570.1 bifunctional glutamate N-acetyltransferase/amino-acid acetyltransferase ArgJ [Alphaproteobacteria bacterium]